MTARLRTYRRACGKEDACGGEVRHVRGKLVHALSNETGTPTCEGGKPLPFEAWGDVTNVHMVVFRSELSSNKCSSFCMITSRIFADFEGHEVGRINIKKGKQGKLMSEHAPVHKSLLKQRRFYAILSLIVLILSAVVGGLANISRAHCFISNFTHRVFSSGVPRCSWLRQQRDRRRYQRDLPRHQP